MALKKKLTKAEYDALTNDLLKQQYKLEGDDYVLDLEGEEDTGALRRAKEHEKAQRLAAEQKQRDAEAALQAERDKQARGTGDVAALDASYQKKLKEQADAAAETLRKAHKSLIGREARALAAEISTVPSLLRPVIEARLTVDGEGEEAIVRVLKDGKLSAMTTEDLKKEIVANKEYASIIIAGKGSGSGANGSSNNGSGGGAAITLDKFKQMGDKERTELFKNDPVLFKSLSAQAAQRNR